MLRRAPSGSVGLRRAPSGPVGPRRAPSGPVGLRRTPSDSVGPVSHKYSIGGTPSTPSDSVGPRRTPSDPVGTRRDPSGPVGTRRNVGPRPPQGPPGTCKVGALNSKTGGVASDLPRSFKPSNEGEPPDFCRRALERAPFISNLIEVILEPRVGSLRKLENGPADGGSCARSHGIVCTKNPFRLRAFLLPTGHL